jgi:hypothetical protein
MRARILLPIIAIALAAGCGLTEAPGAPESQAAPAAALPSEAVPADCVNPPPDVTTLIEQERPVACYGDAELTVQAHAATLSGVMDCPGALEPAWLACGGQQVELFALQTGALPDVLLAAKVPNRGPSMWATVHPDSGLDLHRGLDGAVTVTGHFDDPAAATCRHTAWAESLGPAPPLAEVIAGCRSRFVITQIELLELAEVPDPEPTAEAVPDSAFTAHDIAQVLTTDLVVRSAPGVGVDSEIYDWRLDAPTLLYVFDGPVEADGYDWYQVMPSNLDYLPTPYGVGWVAAASKEGESWIGPAQPACPEPTLEAVASLSGLGALACYGDTELSLEGELGGCVARDAALSPAEQWPTQCFLTPFDCCPNVVPYPSGVAVWNEAVLSHPFDPQASRVIGHFDDASAAGCVDAARDGAAPVPAGWGTFVCRTAFLVTEVVPLDGQQG